MKREQAQILERSIGSAVKVMAGAGTGKTRVLVGRYLKFLMEERIPPGRLLALTFTNKAAAEMRKRIFDEVKTLGEDPLLRDLYGAWIMNFHSFGRRILSENAPAFGLDPALEVAGPVDIERIKRLLLREFEAGRLPGIPEEPGEDILPPKGIQKRFKKCFAITHKCRSMFITPEELLTTVKDDDHPSYKNYVNTVIAVWKAYIEELRGRKLLDFDDMIELAAKGLRENHRVREKYVNQFDHILVDEFQDTSEAQNELLRLLCGGDFQKVTVVGDEKQSIYRWRDARVENIRSFPGEAFVLQRNYRSSQGILDLAHQFICKDDYFHAKRDEIHLLADLDGEGAPIVVFHPEGTAKKLFDEEARALIGWIRHLTDGVPVDGIPLLVGPQANRPLLEYEDIAILLRSLRHNSGVKEYEQALLENNIPYAIVGGANALEIGVLRTFLGLLSLVVFPEDIHSLLLVLEAKPFSIGDRTLVEIFSAANALMEDGGRSRLNTNIILSPEVLSAVSDEVSSERCNLLRRLVDDLRRKNAAYDLQTFLIEAIEDSAFFYQLFEDRSTAELALNLSKELILEVEDLARRHEATLPALLERLKKMIEGSAFGEAGETLLPPRCVRLMTIHQAKGLEFPAVAVSGIKIPPSRRTGFYLSKERGLYFKGMDDWGRGYKGLEEIEEEKDEQRQEERCLLYVAMTRAKDYLFVSSPYPEGKSEKEKTLFVDILESVREGGVDTCEIRHVHSLPAPLKKQQQDERAVSIESTIAALEEWKSTRCIREATRETLPAKRAAIQFVGWRALKTFDECPLKYYYRYVAGVGEWLGDLGEDPLISEWFDQESESLRSRAAPKGVNRAAFGTFVHRILEDVMKMPGKRRDVTIFESRIEELFDQSGIPAKLRAPSVTRASEITRNFLRSPVAVGEGVEYLEEPFDVRLDRLIFGGVFDRVDRIGNGYRILDYKVGEEHEDYLFQVRYYAWALKKIFKGKQVEGALVFLGDEVRVRTVDEGAVCIDMVEKAAARCEAATGSNAYSPAPGNACGSCAYRGICPHATNGKSV